MEERKHHSAGFFNGLMWGAVIGGSLVFLLATKKGRKILRDLSEAGEDFIEDFSSVKPEMDDYETQASPSESTPNKSSQHENNGQSLRKRFFKGVKKKPSL